MTKASPPHLSVAICTYNRAAKLGTVLESLAAARQVADCEVIVVDNNSTDNTSAVLADWARGQALPLRTVFEPKQGLSHARNRAIREATGGIIAFTDDDCLVDQDWLARVARAFAADPDLAIVGGRVELHNPADYPITIRTVADRIEYASFAHVLDLIIGCNFACRRDVFARIGRFDPAMSVGSVLACDDIEFFYRAHRAGLKIVYDPGIAVRHDHGRRADADIARLEIRYIRGRGAMYLKHILRGDGRMLRHAYWEVASNFAPLMRQPLAGRGAAPERRVLIQLLAGAMVAARTRLQDAWRPGG